MKKVGPFGIGVEPFTEDNNRYIDEENDIYPPPLMTKCPSMKSEGFGKIRSAMMYLSINRLREILLQLYNEKVPTENEEKKILEAKSYGCSETLSVFGKDGYKFNIIEMSTNHNFGANIMYENNIEKYEEVLFVVLKNINPKNLEKLFNDIYLQQTIFGFPKINYMLERNLADRPHMLIALWNYGLKYTEDNAKTYKFEPLRKMLKDTRDKPYVIGKRYYLIMDKCPITLKAINTPAILTDGTVYEYEFIKKHLQERDTNPLTNERLICESASIVFKKNGVWHGQEMSAKILYLPERDTFEHFELIN